MARTKQTEMKKRRLTAMSAEETRDKRALHLQFLKRIFDDVKDVRLKFGAVLDGTRLVIKEFSPAGKRPFVRKNRSTVKHTPIHVEITELYPLDKPKLFFHDRSIACSSISSTGEYHDNISWTPAMNLDLYLECVRHALLAAA